MQALKVKLERAQTIKEKFKTTTIKVRKEGDELRDINVATAKALERETKRTQKKEYGQNKFRGALWGSNNKLKLRSAERGPVKSRRHDIGRQVEGLPKVQKEFVRAIGQDQRKHVGHH